MLEKKKEKERKVKWSIPEYFNSFVAEKSDLSSFITFLSLTGSPYLFFSVHFYNILSYIFVLGLKYKRIFHFCTRARSFSRSFFFSFVSFRFIPFRFVSFFPSFLSDLLFCLTLLPSLFVSFVGRLVLSRENRIFRRYGVGKEEECWAIHQNCMSVAISTLPSA